MQAHTKLGLEEARKLHKQLVERVRAGDECGPYTRKRLLHAEQRLAIIAARLRLRGEDVPPSR